jgi:hypothetical protein
MVTIAIAIVVVFFFDWIVAGFEGLGCFGLVLNILIDIGLGLIIGFIFAFSLYSFVPTEMVEVDRIPLLPHAQTGAYVLSNTDFDNTVRYLVFLDDGDGGKFEWIYDSGNVTIKEVNGAPNIAVYNRFPTIDWYWLFSYVSILEDTYIIEVPPGTNFEFAG